MLDALDEILVYLGWAAVPVLLAYWGLGRLVDVRCADANASSTGLQAAMRLLDLYKLAAIATFLVVAGAVTTLCLGLGTATASFDSQTSHYSHSRNDVSLTGFVFFGWLVACGGVWLFVAEPYRRRHKRVHGNFKALASRQAAKHLPKGQSLVLDVDMPADDLSTSAYIGIARSHPRVKGAVESNVGRSPSYDAALSCATQDPFTLTGAGSTVQFWECKLRFVATQVHVTSRGREETETLHDIVLFDGLCIRVIGAAAKDQPVRVFQCQPSARIDGAQQRQNANLAPERGDFVSSVVVSPTQYDVDGDPTQPEFDRELQAIDEWLVWVAVDHGDVVLFVQTGSSGRLFEAISDLSAAENQARFDKDLRFCRDQLGLVEPVLARLRAVGSCPAPIA